MNPRLKYFLIFLLVVLATYFSTKLWNIFPYGNALNAFVVILTMILGVAAALVLSKVFNPKRNILNDLIDLLINFH